MGDIKTCFKKVDYDLISLLNYIDIGDIGLPDIQRPFIWANTRVRDLFDSMYRGFPVGYLLFWENGSSNNGIRQIGLGDKAHVVPMRLIVDGQQRLTSLYAVFRGKKVLDDEYKERKIEIAFRPRDGKFEVADAAIRRDPEWIHDIAVLWAHGKSSWSIINAFVKQLSDKKPLSEEEQEQMSCNIDRLFDLQKYPFTALEIAPTVDEEHVADIFVRINSEGVKLKEADFILTLMSVFWDEGRRELERFCYEARQAPKAGDKPSPFNHLIQPDPDQLVRVAIALGFNRGRIKSVYQVLRGKDPETGDFSIDRRDEQFQRLQEAQVQVLNITYWHQFLSALIGAGFRQSDMISSQNTLIFSYAIYLIGRIRNQLAENVLQRVIGRWFFAANLTGRYTGSPETIMDADLNRLKDAKTPQEFIEALDEIMYSELTDDYWNITLPSALESSSARNPELFCFIAAQNRLGAPVLFSHKKVSELLDPSIKAKKTALERHHLFPRGWLESQGKDDMRIINQIANYSLVEWPDNIDISDTPPSKYLPEIKGRFTAKDWQNMSDLHALPEGWESMNYDDFLVERRKLMAKVIRQGFESIK